MVYIIYVYNIYNMLVDCRYPLGQGKITKSNIKYRDL